MADIIQETKDDIAASGILGAIVGHVGDGNFHGEFSTRSMIFAANIEVAILLYSEEEKKVTEDLVHRMCKRALAMDGTVTGEHGVGLKKREFLREEVGEDTISAMRKVNMHSSLAFKSCSMLTEVMQLKQSLDPLGILNPDKVIHLEAGH